MKKFDVISIFPEVIDVYANTSIFKRAQKKKLLRVRSINLRDFALDKHKTVDDIPYGGGPGMVMKPDVIYRAVQYAKKGDKDKKKTRTILFSTRGKVFSQKEAKRLLKYDHLIFISGRYEGVDERVAEHVADEEISVGDFVLSGGELPALTVIDAVSRHIPGVLGREESLEEKKGSYPVYTRPREFEMQKNGKKKKLAVPKELLGGNHAEIERWRREKGK